MRRLATVGLLLASTGAFGLVGCDTANLTDVTRPAYTVDMPGNTGFDGCTTLGDGSCFAIIDKGFKDLYEQNNEFAREGEAGYNAASGNNAPLANVFAVQTTTVSYALKQLDSFISGVQRSYNQGDYSACAANDLLTRAQYLRDGFSTGTIIQADLDAAHAGGIYGRRCVSPVEALSVTATTTGATVGFSDPWHYKASDVPTPLGYVSTYFIIERQKAATWNSAVAADDSVAPVYSAAGPVQLGPTTEAIALSWAADAGTTNVYRVKQCDYSDYSCSGWVTTTVTIPAAAGGGGGQTCTTPHDNSVHDDLANNNKSKDKCPKK